GNVIDPLELIDAYGADALRFTLAAMAAQGRDIRLSEKRVEGYRNFATKLWNAARFCEMNECLPREGFDPAVSRLTLNRWIVGELAELGGELDRGLEAFRFNDAANAIYRFTWGSFCDWYLELIKPILYGPDGPEKDEVRATAGWALGEIVNLLHPFMPFITEELWARLGPKGAAPLIRAPWPELDGSLRDPQVNEEISWIVQLISEVRTVRAEMNVPAGARIPLKLKGLSERQSAWLASHREAIVALARLESAEADEGPVPKGSVQLALDEASAVLPLSGIVDLAKEQERLAKELDRLDGEIGKLDAKLANAKFIAKAPVHVVEKQRERRAEAAQARTRLKDALARLEP
ncbi:MAG: class I tRNA ligase family protein, partial [Proteobacteria bacterium]|nr:class I tRNA ligase family protein [Pseudomonadota bacterium]